MSPGSATARKLRARYGRDWMLYGATGAVARLCGGGLVPGVMRRCARRRRAVVGVSVLLAKKARREREEDEQRRRDDQTQKRVLPSASNALEQAVREIG